MILFIDRSKKSAENLADMFHYMGILARGMTPSDALSEISPLYRAVVISSPSSLPSVSDYIKRLRSYSQITPIFALVSSKDDKNTAHYFDAAFESSSYSSRLAQAMINFVDTHHLPPIGSYMLAAINASVELSTAVYFDSGIPFTRTETMILRYLIRTYPTPRTAKDILLHTYKTSKMPDPANIRTHISIMNKKFRNSFNRNLIYLKPGEGYVIEPSKKSTS